MLYFYGIIRGWSQIAHTHRTLSQSSKHTYRRQNNHHHTPVKKIQPFGFDTYKRYDTLIRYHVFVYSQSIWTRQVARSTERWMRERERGELRLFCFLFHIIFQTIPKMKPTWRNTWNKNKCVFSVCCVYMFSLSLSPELFVKHFPGR